MKTAEHILTECYQEHKPSTVVCAYSGGYDSMVMVHKTLAWAKEANANLIVATVDTRLAADGYLEYIHNSAHALGVDRLTIWQSYRFPEWVKFVQNGGFGHTKLIHKYYFGFLKGGAFSDILAQYKKSRFDRVMFVTGIRRLESLERRNFPEYDRHGSGVWCNPLLYWNEMDVQSYRIDHDLPENPFYHHGLGSGDCQCNWHKSTTLDELNTYCKEAAEVINPLDAHCREKFGYGYGEVPSELAAQAAAGQLPLFDLDDIPNLCAGCQRPKASQDDIDNMLMQRMDW